ncbi:MAG TPA: enoyl-CoA hydratase-related protein [Chitinophaga sp.]|uniref:enoyl-CoA hydratase/isomerase family protein n=1 Tax=Chitinophaga sp. TaxID=1869181 RepID=UPI002C4840C5|nr:enoyl-CoA hydratase-related protein [Chitinophaga sp.]HVI46905.1 enoyl-CoA hydratase-related protein [Chitinophaga sp.]
MYQTLSTTLNDNILVITINRPDKMNALNRQVMAELGLVVDEVYGDHNIKAAIITGAGDKAFVAGADISEFLELSPKQGEELAKSGHVVFHRIENSTKPIIAAVNGFALGGGCELAMACHFRIASENAKFGQPEVNLGLIPGYGGTQRLTQLIGRGKATELMMTGDMITAADALSWGLVNHVVTAEELLPKAIALLQKILSKAPLAIARVVKCVNAALDKNQDGFETEVKEFAACFATKDLQEGASAFIQKRKPNFIGE